MPSSLQLRFEAVAREAERAMTPSPLMRLFVPRDHRSRERLKVRVQNQAGGYVEFELLEVDLDEGVLIGRGPAGDVRLPFGNVRRIWRRGRFISHSVLLWVGVVLAGALIGALVDVFAGLSIRYMAAGTGAVLGGFGALWLLGFVDKLPLREWITMYDEAAA